MMLLIALALLQQPATFGLQWDPSEGATGYFIYVGTQSGDYEQTPYADVMGGDAIWHPSVPLAPGTYYFVVTAYDGSGVQSGYSNEVSVTIPAIPDPVMRLRISP